MELTLFILSSNPEAIASKKRKNALNATECSISQTSYCTFCNGKDLVYFTGFGITNSSKIFTSLTLNEQQCGSQFHEKKPEK